MIRFVMALTVALFSTGFFSSTWAHTGGSPQTYAYSYDTYGRLTQGTHSGGNGEAVSYDKNGNVTPLTRTGTLDYGARHYVGNLVMLVDPDGQFPETVWDVANIMLDIQSLIDNIKQRNIGASIVDGIGLAVDAAAALLPFIPGGAGTAIKGVRTAGKAADAVSDGFKVVDKASDIKNSIEKAESITEGSSRAARSPQGRRPSQERQLVTKKYPRFDRGWR